MKNNMVGENGEQNFCETPGGIFVCIFCFSMKFPFTKCKGLWV